MDNKNQGVVPTEEELEQKPTADDSKQKFEDQKKRAEKAEAENKELKEKLGVIDKIQSAFNGEEEPDKKDPEGPNPNDRVDELEENLLLKDNGHSMEEIQAIRSYAKGQGKKASDVLNDQFVKSVIKTMRENQEVDQTTPPPTTQNTAATIPADTGIQFNEDGTVKKTKIPTFAEHQAAQRSRGNE